MSTSSHRTSNLAPPRIGIPWRTARQERQRDMRYNRDYIEAVHKAGGDPVQISLFLSPAKLARIAHFIDALVLPGSPADVDPKHFGASAHARSAPPDARREKTDFALLEHALAAGKPVLAICYGTQSLNASLSGSLVQDVPTQVRRPLVHSNHGEDAMHEIRITGGSLAALARHPAAQVNSMHHQSVLRPGRGLRVTAKAADGVIEAVEWTGGPGWALGVQWHPERMPKDPLAQSLFRKLISEAVIARNTRGPRRAAPGVKKPKVAAARRPSAARQATRAAKKTVHSSRAARKRRK